MMLLRSSSATCYLLADCYLLVLLVAGLLSADGIVPHSKERQLKSSSRSSVFPHRGDPHETKDWSITQMGMHKISFQWTISNFSHYDNDQPGQHLESPQFPTGKSHMVKWQMHAYPKGVHDDSQDFLSVRLELVSVDSDMVLPIKAMFELSIIDASGEETNDSSYTNQHELTLGDMLGHNQYIRRDRLLNPKMALLPGDKLTLLCTVAFHHPLKEEKKKDSVQLSEQNCPINTANRLANDLKDMFEGQMLTDVSISTAGQEFEAHKAILSARSPVFRAMFSRSWQEGRTNRVQVNDIKPEVFQELIRYIYTGNFTLEGPTTDDGASCDFAIELLKAASKYQLDELGLICEHHLDKQLSVESVVELLELADEYQAVWLKSRALEFASSHQKELPESGAWQQLAETSPQLYADLLAESSADVGQPTAGEEATLVG